MKAIPGQQKTRPYGIRTRYAAVGSRFILIGQACTKKILPFFGGYNDLRKSSASILPTLVVGNASAKTIFLGTA